MNIDRTRDETRGITTLSLFDSDGDSVLSFDIIDNYYGVSVEVSDLMTEEVEELRVTFYKDELIEFLKTALSELE